MDFETSSVRVWRQLRNAIILGELKPGEKLTRRTLGKAYGVSPITIMEALHRLENEGLVESRPMYGTRVRSLSHEFFVGEQVLREALECQSARLCAERMKKDDSDELQRLADLIDGLSADTAPEDARSLHTEFHIKIASVSQVDALVEEIRKIFLRSFMWATWSSTMQAKPPEGWHNTLLDALRSGDPDRAEKAMRSHVNYNSDLLIDLLEKGEHSF